MNTIVIKQNVTRNMFGPQVADGWTPLLAVVEDGERRVFQITDWIGGTGDKPPVGMYLGEHGLVPTPAEATDIGVPTDYSSHDALASARVPPSVQYVRTAGYAEPGDGGGALYKRVAFEPGHAGKVQSADGAWWELAEAEPSPLMYGAAGDGATNDTPAFNALRSQFNDGRWVNLAGRTYVVTALPPGPNVWANGQFSLDGQILPSDQNATTLSASGDTGGVGAGYTAPTDTATYSPPGRSTRDKMALIASQASRAGGPGRAACVASIYSHARGNVSATVAARQGQALTPQSFVAAVEECKIYGRSRNAIIGSGQSTAEHFMGAIIGSRSGSTSGENQAVLSSRYSACGVGSGALFAVHTSGGQVTQVDVVAGGSGYVSPTLEFLDRTGPGDGATAQATVSGGVITAVTVTNGGSGYSDNSEYIAAGNYESGIAARVDCVAYDADALCNMVAATERSRALGRYSAVVGSVDSESSGNGSLVAGSRWAQASGACSAVVASGGDAGSVVANASGDNSLVAAATGATASGTFSGVICGNNNAADAEAAVVIGSRRVRNSVNRSIAGGNAFSGGISTANRTWHIHSTSGDILSAGTITGSHAFTDYAEYFENAEHGTIPLGTLVALDGRKVRPTQAGDDILGVVSATALVVAGDSPFTWQGRYLTGEFGEILYGDVWDEDEQAYVRGPLENPEYDPGQENIPRSERPDEWTCVGLLGQVHVRVDETVATGDHVAAGDGGVGTASAERTNMRCMEIRQPYDPAKGYAVAFCLIR